MVKRAPRSLLRRVDRPYASALTLSLGAIVALVYSALAVGSYFTLTNNVAAPTWLAHIDASSLHDFVLNGLMTIFFYAIGLELRRELTSGALRHTRDAVAPLSGALGGMLMTAGISLALGVLLSSAPLRRGWGVPMATDLAFTLGALTLAGPRVPRSIRTFLLTLAIADDVLSVVALLIVGATRLDVLWLVAVAILAVGAWRLGRRPRPRLVSVAVLIALWFCFVQAHLEPALAGVLAGVLVSSESATHAQLERSATRLSTLLVLPLFGFVAVGLHWSQVHFAGRPGTVITATVVVRLVGKVIGVSLGALLASRWGFGLPAGMTRSMLISVALLCAMGFTVPLLFATTLFGAASAIYVAFSVGLLIATVVSGVVGVVALRVALR
ncbi:MAG TPA: Na+/H+ antiporter NhaA [Acidimicrobiales bacterium]|nr:MAG: hypothetical protein B7X07_00865 [Actinobacteria bacterium 21-64-8]HQT99031.1 Na+/H+ antiporter NhaA [Acidimicrobiales bacterium]